MVFSTYVVVVSITATNLSTQMPTDWIRFARQCMCLLIRQLMHIDKDTIVKTIKCRNIIAKIANLNQYPTQ